MDKQFDPTDDKKIENQLIHKAQQLENRDYRSLYVNVGIIGILGGIIIFPILLGILFGGWLDETYPVDVISWRLNLMLIGFVFGIYYGYVWVKKEGIQKVDETYDNEQKRMKQGKKSK